MGDGTRPQTQIISLPQGGGAMHGLGEKFSPDLHTGTGNFTVPIAVPPGRKGHGPKLDLVYSTGNGNGYFGLGWTLTVPGVARKTSRGVPRYQGEQDTYMLSGAEDLVPVDRPGPHHLRYRPRTEGLFGRIVHCHNPGVGIDHWTVAAKGGLVSRYGRTRPDVAPATWRDPAVNAHLDLLGTGIDDILYSDDIEGGGRPSMFFLDLTGGGKPRLLTRTRRFAVADMKQADADGRIRRAGHHERGRTSAFGLGWSLGISAIRRQTAKGVPRYQDASPLENGEGHHG